jgi:hypothetical protein
MASRWQAITLPENVGKYPVEPATMLLLTNGSVLVHDESQNGTNRWYCHEPDHRGRYGGDTWRKLKNGPDEHRPRDFACGLLRDGRVMIAGGEYNGPQPPGVGDAVNTNKVSIYDPNADSWSEPGPPDGWGKIGDAPSVVLHDGRFLLGNIDDTRTAIYDPRNGTWQAGPPKQHKSVEETWVLLADNSVLAINCADPGYTERYMPAINRWVYAGRTTVTLVDSAQELGPALTLPNGKTFVVGATSKTALYTPPVHQEDPGQWTAGPDIPQKHLPGTVTGAKDAPACLLPNGRVLAFVGAYDPSQPNDSWGDDELACEYDPDTGTFPFVDPPPAGQGQPPNAARLILLPTGQVLHTNTTRTLGLYTPNGHPNPAWRPTITSAPSRLHPGQTFTLQGKQLNGLSQAVMYGDEGAMATNYPIVRLESVHDETVAYCRTYSHSTMAIHTRDAVHSTKVAIPSHTPVGDYHLVAVANGIASAGLPVSLTRP